MSKTIIKIETQLSIASVSQETLIGKEVLRKWEARYGFPMPARDASGNRIYSPDDVARLRLIKILMDGGRRPAEVVPLPDAALKALVASTTAPSHHPRSAASRNIKAWLRLRDPARLRDNLQRELDNVGLEHFVSEVMPGLNHAVGEAWVRGDIAVHDEHAYSDVIQDIVRQAIAPLRPAAGSPRILITTPEGEPHALGILMLKAFLLSYGVNCVSLGAQTPVDDIGTAAQHFAADIVALSFSEGFPKRRALSIIINVRRELPRSARLWVGGQGAQNLARKPHGVRVFADFSEVMLEIGKWRSSQKPDVHL